MADFPQQGFPSSSKRPYSEYLADTIATQPSNSGIQQREANPPNSSLEFWEFDGSIPAMDSGTWVGQPQFLPYNSNLPLQTSYIGGNPHINFGGHGHNIHQPLALPTAFSTPACVFPSGQMSGILQQYHVIHQDDVWTSQQNYQALMEPSFGFETNSNPQCPPEPELVCFGMIKGLSARYRPPVNYTLSEFSVKLLDAESFVGSDDASIEGKVSYEFTYLTNALVYQSELVLETNCSTLDSPCKPRPQVPGKRIPGYSAECTLDIIIYGPPGLFQDVGSFFEEYDLYLQDPVNCKRNVRYHNPHRLSVDPSDVKHTFELGNPSVPLATTIDISDNSELLDMIFSHQDLAEAPQPRSIRTSLQPHQKQALTFLLQREHGWAWDGCRTDIWEARDTGHEPYFYNTVSGAVQVEQPPQFYGGIVADPMGLGKTLSMIALVACDVRAEDLEPSSLPGVDIEVSSGKTLIIVPAPLMGSWEEQLQRRIFDPETAHYIRNINSQLSRAICSLDSVSRWAVTGTPIQNRLSDLTALLKFLRVHPYSEKRHFDADISSLWKSGNAEKAVQRLKRIASCLLLRRPKDVIQLPPIHNLQLQVQFTIAERQLYEDVRMQVLSQLNDSAPASFKSLQPNFFINILQKIEAMRMICNLGLHYHMRHEKPSLQGLVDDWQSEAQKAFNLRREEGTIQCHLCGLRLDEMESLVDEGVQKAISANEMAGLDYESIPCLRFDGTIAQKERHSVIERFRHDPQIRVLLLTLTCGAVGLTLTEASRAYLMEPSWNPTLEDQALARIHRIGQTQEVTTLRMFVQNSFEERIIEAQASKRDLARILLTPPNGDETETESGLDRLEVRCL
ncbi:global transactivator [Fusarium mexicanum]|uniref:Global transactivator n=1 Tax=Fusarium mexicanum TaxID=751941 RepID=A0A8H5J5B0_9HYPO|nr:global transactivator [Fusarium mexicanum]